MQISTCSSTGNGQWILCADLFCASSVTLLCDQRTQPTQTQVGIVVLKFAIPRKELTWTPIGKEGWNASVSSWQTSGPTKKLLSLAVRLRTQLEWANQETLTQNVLDPAHNCSFKTKPFSQIWEAQQTIQGSSEWSARKTHILWHKLSFVTWLARRIKVRRPACNNP